LIESSREVNCKKQGKNERKMEDGEEISIKFDARLSIEQFV